VDEASDKKSEKLETELQEAGVDTQWWKQRTTSALEVAKSVKEGLNKYVVDPVREKISVDYSKESLERRIDELKARFDGLKNEKDAHEAKITDLENLIREINPNILAVEELL